MSCMHHGTAYSLQLSSCRGDMGLKMRAFHKQHGMPSQQQERDSHLKLASISSHSTFHFLDRHFTFHSGCSRAASAREALTRRRHAVVGTAGAIIAHGSSVT